MKDDQFTKLFTYMQDEFAKVEQRFKKVGDRLDQVMAAVDEVLKNQEADEQERLVMNQRLDRHERWHEQAAKHTGVKLSYE